MTMTAEPQVNYGLSEEHEALRESVRDFAETVVAPRAAEVDRTATYPWDVHEALRKNELLALHVGEAVRRRRRRRDLHRDRHRGAVAGRRERRPHRRGEQARHDRPAALGQRGAQAALPAARRHRRGDVLVRPVGARGRLGRRRDAHPGRPRRRRLRPRRHQGVDQPGRRLDPLHGHGRHRAGRRRARHLGVRRPRRRPGLQRRHAGAQARHQGLADVRDPLRGLPHPGRPHDRRARHRLQDGARHARPHPPDHRRPGGRHRAGQRRRRRSPTPRSAASSASRCRTSRACSSCSPTWP